MTTRLPGLDGLRAIAAFAVIGHHCGVISSFGWLGVDLFFVLSGFLITTILLDAKGGHWWTDYGRPFYMRRALRILPLAFVALAIVLWGIPAVTNRPRVPWSEQIWLWTFLSNWHPATTTDLLSHFWTLAIEEQFYLVWPWVILAVPLRQVPWFCAGLFALSFVGRIVIVQAGLPITLIDGTPFRLDGLVLGAGLAALSRLTDLSRYVTWARVIGSSSAIGALVIILVGHHGILSLSSLISAAVVAFGAALVITRHATPRWLTARWLTRLGVISYGIYVIQKPAMKLLEPTFHKGWTLAAAVVLVTVPLAWLSWRVLEQPMLRLKRYWPMPSGRES